MNRNVLLTGGAGYIGGHVALALQGAGWCAVILDDLSTGNRRALLPGTVFYEDEIGGGGRFRRVRKRVFQKIQRPRSRFAKGGTLA